MRKVVAVLIIVLVTMIYFVSVRKDVEQKNTTQMISSQIEQTITSYQEDYPETIEDVVRGHAALMKLQYSEGTDAIDIPLTVEGLRLFYAEETLVLNTEESQIATVTQEIASNALSGIYLIQSDLEGITYKEEEVIVKMKHATTKGDVYREYILITENGQWKIKEWRAATQ